MSSKKFQYICVSLDVNFNESLTNDIVSFEQLGPGLHNHKSIYCGHSLEAPWRGTSIEYPHNMFPWRNKKNIRAQLFKTNNVVS